MGRFGEPKCSRSLVPILAISARKLPTRSFIWKNWGDDAFARGAYGSYWTQGLWTTYGPELRAPIDSLHWAGTETSPNWNGKMEGAVQSGQNAATEVLAAL